MPQIYNLQIVLAYFKLWVIFDNINTAIIQRMDLYIGEAVPSKTRNLKLHTNLIFFSIRWMADFDPAAFRTSFFFRNPAGGLHWVFRTEKKN